LNKKLGCGSILGEDGREAYFDLSSLEEMDIRTLSIENRWNTSNTLAAIVGGLQVSKSYRIPEANPRRELRVELSFADAMSPTFAANSGARNDGERIDHQIAWKSASRLHHGRRRLPGGL
jgi:hypothetical protein